MNEFKLGDVVALKHELYQYYETVNFSPLRMTIQSITKNEVFCIYANQQYEFQEHIFNKETLGIIDDERLLKKWECLDDSFEIKRLRQIILETKAMVKCPKVGDVVKLKTDYYNNCLMTVQSISDNQINCIWFLDKSTIKERAFIPEVLTIIEKPVE